MLSSADYSISIRRVFVISSLRTSTLTRSLHVTCSRFVQSISQNSFAFSLFFLLSTHLVHSFLLHHLKMIVLSSFLLSFWEFSRFFLALLCFSNDQFEILWTKTFRNKSRKSTFRFVIFYEQITSSMISYSLTLKTLFRILSKIRTHRSHSSREKLASRSLRIISFNRKREQLIMTSSRKLSSALKKSSIYRQVFQRITRESRSRISSISWLNHSSAQSWFYQSLFLRWHARLRISRIKFWVHESNRVLHWHQSHQASKNRQVLVFIRISISHLAHTIFLSRHQIRFFQSQRKIRKHQISNLLENIQSLTSSKIRNLRLSLRHQHEIQWILQDQFLFCSSFCIKKQHFRHSLQKSRWIRSSHLRNNSRAD